MSATGRNAQITELFSQLALLMAEPEPRRPAEAQAPPPARVLLTVEETAEQLGIGKTKTYALVKSGDLESVMIGRLRRIHVESIREFAARLVAEKRAA